MKHSYQAMPNPENDADALFAAWHDDRAGEQPRPLAVWLDAHPAHADDLLTWAGDAPILDCVSDTPDAYGETRTRTIGRSVLAEFCARYLTVAAPETPLTSLYARAQTLGMKPADMAARLGLGLPLIAKLQQRAIEAVTLPDRLIASLSETLQTSADSVRAYLQQPQTLAVGVRYKADGVPQTGAQESWERAVRACPGMSETEKSRWLGE